MLITTLPPVVRTQRRGVKRHEKLGLQCGKTGRNAIEEIEKAWAIAGAVQEPQRMLVIDNFYALHVTLERLVRLYPPVDKNQGVRWVFYGGNSLAALGNYQRLLRNTNGDVDIATIGSCRLPDNINERHGCAFPVRVQLHRLKDLFNISLPLNEDVVTSRPLCLAPSMRIYMLTPELMLLSKLAGHHIRRASENPVASGMPFTTTLLLNTLGRGHVDFGMRRKDYADALWLLTSGQLDPNRLQRLSSLLKITTILRTPIMRLLELGKENPRRLGELLQVSGSVAEQ